jgi:serine/threonine protein kinase
MTMDLRVGEGKFKIIKKLGSGAFGEIYKGKRTHTKRRSNGIKNRLER